MRVGATDRARARGLVHRILVWLTASCLASSSQKPKGGQRTDQPTPWTLAAYGMNLVSPSALILRRVHWFGETQKVYERSTGQACAKVSDSYYGLDGLVNP
jgi:hypothetical protein